MPHLSRTAGGPHQWAAVDDKTAAHADVAGDVYEVARPDTGPPRVLCHGAEVRVVGDENGQARPDPVCDELAQPDIPPAEVRGKVHQTVRSADDGRKGYPQAGNPGMGGDRGLSGLDELQDVLDGLLESQATRPMGDPIEVEDSAPQSDHGRRQGVDGDIGGDGNGTLGIGTDHQRRTPGRPQADAVSRQHQSTCSKVRDQFTDRAPGHPQSGADVGPRHCP